MSGNNDEPCSTCGGDKRIANSFGSLTTCPSCRGTGRRVADEPRFHDVTKTKPSHHGTPASRAAAAKPTAPVTAEGIALAGEIESSPRCAADTKARLIREVMDHESTHGRCTQTFIKKIRKQVRPAT